MAHIRDFSARERLAPLRNVEDAPQSMRQELIDLFFTLIEDLPQPNPLQGTRLTRHQKPIQMNFDRETDRRQIREFDHFQLKNFLGE
jgi:hypothetical protein